MLSNRRVKISMLNFRFKSIKIKIRKAKRFILSKSCTKSSGLPSWEK